jgi:TPR repeat protein
MQYAENRSDITQFELGQMFRKAPHQERDYEQAANWYRRAAKKGNVKAQYLLGLMYTRGLGVNVNYLKAYAWLKLAAAQGSRKAFHILQKIASKIPPERQQKARDLSRVYYAKYATRF